MYCRPKKILEIPAVRNPEQCSDLSRSSAPGYGSKKVGAVLRLCIDFRLKISDQSPGLFKVKIYV